MYGMGNLGILPLLSTLILCCGLALALAVSSSEKKEIREVFVVPHSHCDAGWLQTVEGYYDSRVELVLTTVTEQLATNPDARFVWAETIWFAMWWPNQPESTRDIFRKALKEGRIEFVGGGWVQNDETNVPWRDVLEQTTTGHEYLRQELGDLGKVRWGWQLDMFSGYSAVTPTLWSFMGYEGMVIRFEGPDSERERWNDNKAYQFYWEGSASLKEKTRIFTHCLDGNYGTMIEKNLNFDDPGVAGLTPSNIATQLQPLLEWLHNETLAYQGPIMALWGSDFQFFNASVMFGNMSLAMDWINSRSDTLGFRLRYSTVSEYMDHLSTLKMQFPTLAPTGSLSKDYGNDFEFGWPHPWMMNLTGNYTTQYQTGAPSSRPRHKQRSRALGAQRRMSETLSAMASLAGKPGGGDEGRLLRIGREVHGVVQHHDSIPGTMSTFGSFDGWGAYDSDPNMEACRETTCMCLEDYTHRLQVARDALDKVIVRSVSALLGVDRQGEQDAVQLGIGADARHNEYSAAETLGHLDEQGTNAAWADCDAEHIIVHNPLAHRRSSLVHVPIPRSMRREATLSRYPSIVNDATGETLTAQVDMQGDGLYFLADVAGFAFETYTMVADGGKHTVSPTIVDSIDSIETRQLGVKVNHEGLVIGVENKRQGVSMAVEQSYYEYHNGTGGAYVLIEVEYAQRVSAPMKGRTTRGPLFSEIEQEFTNYLFQRIRLVEGSDVVDVRHAVMTLPLGVEVVSRLATDLSTSGTLHTDDSGLELHTRKWNPSLPLSGNYYAVVQSTSVRDENNEADIDGETAGHRQLSVLTSHTMGVSTIGGNGMLEYMLHRRLNASDDQGPWPLNDTDTLVTDVMWFIGAQNTVEPLRLARASELEHPLLVAMTEHRPHNRAHGANTMLPHLKTSHVNAAVQVISFYQRPSPHTSHDGDVGEPVAGHGDDREYVLRLQNIVEQGGSTVTINVPSLFHGLCVASSRPMTLSLQHKLTTTDVYTIEIEPIDIVTLLLTFKRCP